MSFIRAQINDKIREINALIRVVELMKICLFHNDNEKQLHFQFCLTKMSTLTSQIRQLFEQLNIDERRDEYFDAIELPQINALLIFI